MAIKFQVSTICSSPSTQLLPHVQKKRERYFACRSKSEPDTTAKSELRQVLSFLILPAQFITYLYLQWNKHFIYESWPLENTFMKHLGLYMFSQHNETEGRKSRSGNSLRVCSSEEMFWPFTILYSKWWMISVVRQVISSQPSEAWKIGETFFISK